MSDVVINGFLAGISQTVLGHPFDTIKTRKQMYPYIKINNIAKNIIKKEGIRSFYKGYLPPLLGGCIQNSFIFSTEHYFNNYFQKKYITGFFAGGITSFILSPFELIKCRMQINQDKKLSLKETIYLLKKNNVKLSRGTGLTFLRDSIGFSLYFSIYNSMQEYNNNPLINGGFAGVVSWIYSYPIDVLKTKYQLSNQESLNYIIKSTKFKHLTSGMWLMLVRSFIVNAGIFYIFENLSN